MSKAELLAITDTQHKLGNQGAVLKGKITAEVGKPIEFCYSRLSYTGYLISGEDERYFYEGEVVISVE